MSRRHSHGRRSGRRRGPIKRVIRGLADAFGIPRGVVIAGFVLGFISIPLLTVLVFFAALYWVDYPERTRRQMDAAYDSVRRAANRLWRGVTGPRRSGVGGEPEDRESREPPRPAIDPGVLARRFERIERRARAIEEFVASEEFRLNREFRRMERE